jgi:hypothetical protein
MATGWVDRHNSPMIVCFNLGMQLSFKEKLEAEATIAI